MEHLFTDLSFLSTSTWSNTNPTQPIPSHPFMGYFNLILNGRSFASSANFGYDIIFSPICFLKHSTVLLCCYYPDLKIHMYSRMGGVPNWPKPVMFIITLWFRLRGYTQQRYQACWMLGNVAHFGVHSCNWVLVIIKWMYNLFNWKFYNTNWNESPSVDYGILYLTKGGTFSKPAPNKL